MKGCFILLGILASSNVVLNSNGMWFAVWWIVLFQFLVYDFLALMLNTCVKVERRRDGERERERKYVDMEQAERTSWNHHPV